MSETLVDKLLKEAIERNEKLCTDYEKQRAALNNQIAILSKENAAYLAEYQKNCAHKDSVKEVSHHMAGGYDHVSETQYVWKCVRCNKVTGSKLERGTYA